MLDAILSKAQCAECRLCCSFDSYGLFDTPVIVPEAAEGISGRCPDVEFWDRGSHRLLKMVKQEEGDVYLCPLLDPCSGCRMGDEKPFDCRIWPLRIMEREGRLVIALSMLCPEVKKLSPEQVRGTAEALSGQLFEYAHKYPCAVRPYSGDCLVLVTESV